MARYDANQLKKTIRRIVKETQKKIDQSGIKVEDILGEPKYEFPVSKDTWYKYKAYLKSKKSKNMQAIKISSLYDFCEYTEVSADYFLGFNKTRVKESSASQIQKDFGFSDEALKVLGEMRRNRYCICDSCCESDLVDYFIKNFAKDLVTKTTNYYCAVNALEEHNRKYTGSDGLIKEEYLAQEGHITVEYQDLESNVYYTKYIVEEKMKEFIESFRKYLTNKESTQCK